MHFVQNSFFLQYLLFQLLNLIITYTGIWHFRFILKFVKKRNLLFFEYCCIVLFGSFLFVCLFVKRKQTEKVHLSTKALKESTLNKKFIKTYLSSGALGSRDAFFACNFRLHLVRIWFGNVSLYYVWTRCGKKIFILYLSLLPYFSISSLLSLQHHHSFFLYANHSIYPLSNYLYLTLSLLPSLSLFCLAFYRTLPLSLLHFFHHHFNILSLPLSLSLRGCSLILGLT